MIDEKNLYALNPQEFEKLVADLLGTEGFAHLRLVGGPADKGIDMIGELHDRPVAIQAKHKLSLSPREIEKFVQKYFSDPLTPRTLVYVTSADVPDSIAPIQAHLLPGQEFRLMARKDILRLINGHPDIANHFFQVAEKRISRFRIELVLGLAGLFLSLISLTYSSYTKFVSPRAALDTRIKTVENALSSIRDLETDLNKIKEDMVMTEKATQLLNEKYSKAKELERMTHAQVEALRLTLQTESWHRTLFNYIMGFILGIASSFVASVLFSKWRQREALK